MNSTVYAFICTRSESLSSTTKKLTTYLSRSNVKVKLLVDSKSIFSGYKKAFDKVNPDDDDIVILCHDDIEIISDENQFLQCLIKELLIKENTGFVGVAGTKELTESGVWWDQNKWKENKHSGFVLHGKRLTDSYSTYYGPYGEVVVMDGLFLAATAKTIRRINLGKPDYLSEDWDFYDLHYTLSAHKIGLKNRVVPIFILHNSSGELAGRESWHKNRLAFLKKHQKSFPITI